MCKLMNEYFICGGEDEVLMVSFIDRSHDCL